MMTPRAAGYRQIPEPPRGAGGPSTLGDMSARLSRRQLFAGAGLTAAAGLSGCGSSKPAPPKAQQTSATPTPSTAATSPKPTFNEAALRKKIASLLVVGFRGQSVSSSDWIVKAIKNEGLGGVILFDRDQLTGQPRNITSPSQVTKLIKQLTGAAPGPLIVSIDQEGGQISRLNPSDGFPATRSQAQIGAINKPATTIAWAQGMTKSMRSIGVTMNFAPVVDLNVNPNNPAIGQLGRSFSANPSVVVSNATEEIKVHRAAGIKTSIKHFPGFGSATGNTDFGVVDVSKTWKRVELEPFQQLIKTGMTDSVLVAHLLNKQLDASRPMSLSKKVVTDLLRGQLGWKGPVVSDDMQAVGITDKYGHDAALTLALQAGVDLLVYANQQVYDAGVVEKTVNTVVKLVKDGTMTEAQIDAAVARVNTLRPKN
jgi:beta-N-acetylhexosaminidase